MILDVENSLITLNTANTNLKKYHDSQLRFFGFKNLGGKYYKQSVSFESDIKKVIEYFNNEGVEIIFSTKVMALVSEIHRRNSQTDIIFQQAKRIKDGNIDKNLLSDFENFTKKLPRKLKSHQIKAAFHLYTIANGANFSVPGSGKTSVVLTVYEKLLKEGKCNLLFVVGPPSCFQPWQNEYQETLGRSPQVIILSGGNKEIRKSEYYTSQNDISELYLSTFHTMSNDSEDVARFLQQKGVNAFFVIDEAHYMKQAGGAWANSLLKIATYAKFRCVLTGTPIPRSYADLFNLFDFLWPNTSPLSEEDKIQIRLWEKNGEDKAAKAFLEEKIGPLFYRVRKQDLGLKPAIFHEPIMVRMNPVEQRIYDLIKSRIFELSKKDFLENEELLNKLWRGRIIRLRQAISYPKLLITAVEDYEEDVLDQSELAAIIQNYDSIEVPGKLDLLTSMILNFQQKGEKVLIWSNFVGTLELIKSHFTNLNLRSELIYGKTPLKKGPNINELAEEMTREEIRDVFVDPNSGLDILIANPAACAESISLHKSCFHAIYYDLSYNCAQYLQSLDRIHRVGGSEVNTANYYFLQYESSIDQDIKLNLEIKAQKMYAIVEQDYGIYSLDIFEELPEDDIAAYKRLFYKNKT
ncbi:MAG: DEAD/DEAH box helicase [Anaerolineae bacterium]|nr:DEAD/DEAH box helicase [Anaerolineae bacterium]